MNRDLPGRMLCALLCLLAIAVPPTAFSAAGPILAPFGLRWGLAPEDLEEILRRSKIPIVSKEQDGQLLNIEATALPQKNVLRAIFHFESGILLEVELQLGLPAWTDSDYNRYFLETKKVLDSRYGRGLPLVLDKRTEGDAEVVLSGYQWGQFGGTIRLLLFQAHNPTEEVHVLSQHYRAY